MTEWILDSIRDTRLTSRDLREIAHALRDATKARTNSAAKLDQGIEQAEAFARDLKARGYLLIRADAVTERAA